MLSFRLKSLGRPRHGLLSFLCITEAMKYEVPCPTPRPSQLRWSFHQYLCTGATFLISSYPSLLISSCSSHRCYSLSSYSSLLILLFLYFKLFVVLQTCILMIYVQFLYTYPSFWGVFRRGQAFFIFLFFSIALYSSSFSYSSLLNYNLTVCCREKPAKIPV